MGGEREHLSLFGGRALRASAMRTLFSEGLDPEGEDEIFFLGVDGPRGASAKCFLFCGWRKPSTANDGIRTLPTGAKTIGEPFQRQGSHNKTLRSTPCAMRYTLL